MPNDATLVPVDRNLINKHNVPLSYEKAKAAAIKHQPLIGDFPLEKVELGRNRTLKVDGKIMPVSDKAYNQFLKNVLDVHPTFVKTFKEVTDEKTEIQMLTTLQRGLAAKKGERVKVITNAQTMGIVGFQPKNFNYITNEAMLRVFEQVMNEYPELELKDMYIRNDGTLTINSRTTRVHNFGKHEDFNGGLTFRNNPSAGTNVGHNALRLICTNGMIGMGELSKFSISGDPAQLEKFFQSIRGIAAAGFMTNQFARNIERAQNIDASVAELRACANIMTKHSSLTREELGNYLPIRDVTSYLAKRGVEYSGLSAGQARNCPTGMNLWDMVNIVTDFGSHDNNLHADFARIQVAAGGLLDRKHYDGENIVVFKN